MNKKLYNLMDWAGIEEIVYGEAAHPEKLLGAHTVGASTLVQAFFPGSKSVSLYIYGKDTEKGRRFKEEVKMEQADEAGFYAVLLSGKNRSDYVYHVSYDEKGKDSIDVKEVYKQYTILGDDVKDKIMSGAEYKLQEKLGSVKMTIDGVRGTAFSVWAPNALRVSVVGDFNRQNGLANQMIKDDLTGIFELFIPDLEAGEKYNYEVLIKGGEKVFKTDPFAFETAGDGECTSVVSSRLIYKWTDKTWTAKREKSDTKSMPMKIYEISADTFSKKCNIKEIAEDVIKHMDKFGYTHVELMPVFDYYNDSLGFKPSMFFALNHRLGKTADMMSFVNALHEKGYGVIVQMPLGSFDEGIAGMGYFDGTCLFEHEDYRKGIDPRTGAKIFQLGNPVVEEMLISSVLYWINAFHLDGIKLMDLSSMLYLDYYRSAGEWVPNIYGTNENIEAIAFLRKLNAIIHKNCKGVFTIADEESGWPYITMTDGLGEEEKQNCLGFDYAVNRSFITDTMNYMCCDPIMRSGRHNDIVASTLYQYRENYILTVAHSDVDFGKGGLIERMPGSDDDKLANLKAYYGYIMTHPGKKAFFMGQDEAAYNSFDGKGIYDMSSYNDDIKNSFSAYISDLMKYLDGNKALYCLDYSENGFAWINNSLAKDNILIFERKAGDNTKESQMVIINFANKEYTKYRIPVPYYGKYTECFNSDSAVYGGGDRKNTKVLISKKADYEGFEQSIGMRIAPLSMLILSYVPFTKAELDEMERKRVEREKLISDKKKKRDIFLKEKLKIKKSLRKELEKKIREAEEAMQGNAK